MFESIVRKFLYYPLVLRPDAPLPAYARDAREIFCEASDGNTIHGLYWPARSGRPTILFLHGNAQSVYEWALIREELEPLDCGLLLIDYPGYGKSSGRPREESLYAAGEAMLNWLLEEQSISENQLILFGKSLGGGVTTKLAPGRCLLGVVLESTFRSIPSVVDKLIPMLPADAVFKSERYASIERIDHITAPVLVVHGEEDELIPLAEGQALFEKANPPKDFYLVPGAGHNDVSMIAGAAYGKRLRQWLDSIFPE